MPLTAIGYHGTTEEAADKLVRENFQLSENSWEWLGHGVYFWQDAPKRAREWARSWLSLRKKYDGPVAVVAAEIDLTDFVDMLDLEGVQRMREVVESFAQQDDGSTRVNEPPKNYLDCAIFNVATKMLSSEGLQVAGYRACCVEGTRLVENSPIYDRSHVQLAVLDQSTILRKWLVKDDEQRKISHSRRTH